MASPYAAAPQLTEKQFAEWRDLLEQRLGIRLNPNQRQFLQSQVAMRMREVGEEDFGAYFRHISDGSEGKLEWAILLDRLVVKETSFFRHRPSLDAVCRHLQERINNSALSQSYDVWSLGCASGEEPYSLAMLINESFELARLDSQFSLTGTDVSRVAISLARAACFSERKLQFVPPALRTKYFHQRAVNQFHFEHEVSRRLCFNCANVLDLDVMPKLDFDVVYCQNLLIYFPQRLREKILDEIVEKLKPGGLLVIGLGEVINWQNPRVSRINRADVQAYQCLARAK